MLSVDNISACSPTLTAVDGAIITYVDSCTTDWWNDYYFQLVTQLTDSDFWRSTTVADVPYNHYGMKTKLWSKSPEFDSRNGCHIYIPPFDILVDFIVHTTATEWENTNDGTARVGSANYRYRRICGKPIIEQTKTPLRSNQKTNNTGSSIEYTPFSGMAFVSCPNTVDYDLFADNQKLIYPQAAVYCKGNELWTLNSFSCALSLAFYLV